MCEVEQDEQWSCVGKKSNPRWLWYPIDRSIKTILAYVFDRRKDAVFAQLKTLLEPFNILRIENRRSFTKSLSYISYKWHNSSLIQYLINDNAMPILHWLSREDDLQNTPKVPYRVLQADLSLSVGDANTSNMLIQGDNLDALKSFLPYYAGQVKCIYIDPPYNTKSAFISASSLKLENTINSLC